MLSLIGRLIPKKRRDTMKKYIKCISLVLTGLFIASASYASDTSGGSQATGHSGGNG